MSAPRRRRLTNRRPAITTRIEAAGIAAHATVGFDVMAGAAREVFLRPTGGGKTGSALDLLLDDVAVVISVALQHGVPVTALSKSTGSTPEGAPASIVGAALDLVVGEGGAS